MSNAAENGRIVMQYITIKDVNGKDIKLSKYVLGAPEHNKYDREACFKVIDRFRELGGNAFDLARFYGWPDYGACERIVAEYIKDRDCRDEVVVIDKGAMPELNKDTTFKRLRITREAILGDFYTSIDDMGIGPVDCWLLHRDDESKPIPYIMDIMQELVESGLTRSIGVSNWSIARIKEANEYQESLGRPKLVLSEIQWGYSYLTKKMRNDESVVIMNPEVHKEYEEYPIPIIAYTSQCGGLYSYLYSGKETWDTLSGWSRPGYKCKGNMQRFEKVKQYCDEHGCSPAALITAYLTNNSIECGPIIGSHSIEQVEDTMSGRDLVLDQATIDWMDDIDVEE